MVAIVAVVNSTLQLSKNKKLINQCEYIIVILSVHTLDQTTVKELRSNMNVPSVADSSTFKRPPLAQIFNVQLSPLTRGFSYMPFPLVITQSSTKNIQIRGLDPHISPIELLDTIIEHTSLSHYAIQLCTKVMIDKQVIFIMMLSAQTDLVSDSGLKVKINELSKHLKTQHTLDVTIATDLPGSARKHKLLAVSGETVTRPHVLEQVESSYKLIHKKSPKVLNKESINKSAPSTGIRGYFSSSATQK